MPRSLAIASWLFVFGVLAAVGAMSDNRHVLTLTIQTMMLAALASSWNILGGFAGQISLGHAAFFGLGALVARELWLGGTPFPLAVVAATAVAAVAAAIVGVPLLRLRGIYFAVGTLALGVAVYITVGNNRPGLTSLPAEALRSYQFTGPYFYTLGVLILAVAVSMWLLHSKVGLGMMAVRDDEEAAASTGVNAFSHKMAAFVLSAALAAMAGTSFAYFSVGYYPNFPFSVVWTFEAILVVFIGGVGTVVGPLVGSGVFIVGRDALPSGMGEFQVVLFGVLFIVVVLLMPGGITEAAQSLFQRSRRDATSPATTDTEATNGKELV
jgi:branched-chain amino acid transport system permease protein